MSSHDKAMTLLHQVEVAILNGRTLTVDESLQMAATYAQLALLEPPPSDPMTDVAAFVRSIDPKELERVVLERDDLHEGLTAPMLDQIARWAEGR